MSEAMLFSGFRVLPVDWLQNDHKAKVPFVTLDLADESQCAILRELITAGDVQVIWAGVPCGTCSRAREIPLSSSRHGPKPLRSAEHPRGLPNLSPDDRARVNKANAIYDNVAKLILLLIQLGGLFVIENPRGSYLWLIDCIVEILNSAGVFIIDFQHCKWTPGPARAKWTRLVTNIANLQRIEGPCTSDHEHLGWGISPEGKFATSYESEYAPGMCAVISEIIAEVCRMLGFCCVPLCLNADIHSVPEAKRRRIAGAKQPRGKAVPPVISEFAEVTKGTLKQCRENEGKVLRIVVPHPESKGDGKGWAAESTEDLYSELSVLPSTKPPQADVLESMPENTEVVYGKFRSPEDFLEQAVRSTHPLDMGGAIPDDMVESICCMLESEPADYVKFLLQQIRDITKLVADTTLEDNAFRDSLDPEIRQFMGCKKFATTQRLALSIGHPDKNIVHQAKAGFPIVGLMPYTELFQYELSIPTCEPSLLRSLSPVNNQAILTRCTSSGDSTLDREVWDMCMEEQSKGWIKGPYKDCTELTNELGYEPHLSRRFGLRQTSKVRLIDDFRESAVNTACGMHDKIDLHDADVVSSVIRGFEQCALSTRHEMEFILSGGTVRKCKAKRAWFSKDSKWKGKTFDLKAAYKQLYIHQSDRWAANVVVFNPITAEPNIFAERTLPFGASAAVLHFNRFARLLWSIGIKKLHLPWLNFYDDFPTLISSWVETSVQSAVQLLFKLLGWTFVDDPAKDRPFSELFVALGVVFNVSRLNEGLSTVCNKPERVKTVREEIRAILNSGKFTTVQSDSLRGKLGFMERQVFGKSSRAVIRTLTRTRYDSRLRPTERDDLSWIDTWLASSNPRFLSPPKDLPMAIIFTDGACEFEGSIVASCGAVLYTGEDDPLRCWGGVIGDSLVSEWAVQGKRQVVTEAELLPILISRRIWADRIRNRKVIHFVDSNPALFSSLKGVSDVESCQNIIKACCMEENNLNSWIWYSRVPSKSNCADMPSRLKFWQVNFGRFNVVQDEFIQPITLRGGTWE